MASVNRVMLIGNIVRDPETRYTQSGSAIGKITLACNRKYTSNGERKDDVTYVDVTLFGRTAENVQNYCKKGSSIYVEGRLNLDSWQDKATGQNRSKLGVVAESVQFMNTNSDQGEKSQGNSNYRQNSSYQSNPQSNYPPPPPMPTNQPQSRMGFNQDQQEDDIPF